MMNCKLIFYTLAMTLLFSACTDELEKQGKEIVEGVPVVAQFSYKVEESEQVQSRTAQDPTVEKTVVQLFALAFDSDGALSGSGPVTVNSTGTGTGTFTLPMSSGSNKTLYLVANYEKGTGGLVDEEGNTVNLEDIQSLDEFKKVGYVYNETNRNQVDRSLFLMVGSTKDDPNGTTDGTFDVDANGNVVRGNSVVYLNRVSARINFNIKAEAVADGTLTNLKFDPYYYYVDNIPQGTYLVSQDVDWKAGQEGNYSSMSGTDHRHLDHVDPDGLNSYFTFYLMENRLAPRKQITEEDRPKVPTGDEDLIGEPTLYSLREKRDKGKEVVDGHGQQYEQGPFSYAPEYGTYVVIYGRVQGKQTDLGPNPGSDVFADARFIIHLGETGSNANDINLVNNYNTCRNVQYTYNVTITGVHSMHVEVKKEFETRPGVEGDLIMTQTGAYFDLDAHFNTAVFKVDLSQWSDDKTPPVSWAYSTPFGRAMKTLDRTAFITENGVTKINNESALQTDLTNNDYKWIQFAINRENLEINDSPATSVVPYPGEGAYTGSKNNGPAPALGESTVARKKLYDVNQLMNRLYLIYKNKEPYIETDGTVVVTAYIDEFLYTYDPTEEYYKAPGRTTGINTELWKRSINENPRWLYLSTDSKFSPDGATSMANAIVVFSQRPIYTIYNASNVNVTSAWGTESIVEDTGYRGSADLRGELEPYNMDLTAYNAYPNNRVNGYANTVYWLTQKSGSLNWADYIDYSKGLTGTDKYKLASAMKNTTLQEAPLLRNRDFNGDGRIDANEIRWYLGAFSQLQGLVLGKSSLPRAQLYDQSKYVKNNEVTQVHFASSTYIKAYGEGYLPIKVWGEQEGANGPSDGQGTNGGNVTGDYYLYRCMRNLGTSTPEEIPQDYVIVSAGWGGSLGTFGKEAVFDLSRLDVNSLRSPFMNTILPEGLLERDPYGNSRPSRKFAVLLRKPGETGEAGGAAIYTFHWSTGSGYEYLNKLTELINNERGASYHCPDGYRMPNQGELLIMHAYSNSSNFVQTPATDEIFYNDGQNYLYMAKSAFSYKNMEPYASAENGPYPAFIVTGSNVALANKGTGNSGYGLRVRCVRDIE